MTNFYAVIIAGGVGERLWPLSKKGVPKQLLSLTGRSTLVQDTFERIKPLFPKGNIVVVTRQDQAAALKKQMPALKSSNVIEEPIGRNTAAAIGLAAITLKQRDPNGVMVVLPADGRIIDIEEFHKDIRSGRRIAEAGWLVTFGISPDYPATGYGYIKRGTRLPIAGSRDVYKIKGFVEKPSFDRASKLLQQEGYYWNSGIFSWTIPTILAKIKRHIPKLFTGLCRIEESIGKASYKSTLKRVYGDLNKVSIDKGIMEKVSDAVVIPSSFRWSDIGNWSSLTDFHKKDRDDNVILGDHVGIDTSGVIVVGDKDKLIATCGVNDLIIVNKGDVVLVCRKDRAEDVKRLHEIVKKKNHLKKYV
ncbi:MAG: mannose-1-phosphate guanylyltransferase [Candidatus Omnitrophica bacterium]|nr:mannose-1-phosphate guanylyltransferase [Candidatus Omnitrophota bacterium]